MKNDTNINEIETKLIDSVVASNLTDIGTDVSESFLDVLLQDGIAQNIPILGTLYKLGKVGFEIREQYFAKKVLRFLHGIKDLSEKDRTKFVTDLDDPEFGQRAGETLTILLDRFDNLEKPLILANLLKAKVEDKIDMTNFLRLSSVVEKAFLPDVKRLAEYKRGKHYNAHETESLRTLGLIYKSVSDSNGINNIFAITSLGNDLLMYGLAN